MQTETAHTLWVDRHVDEADAAIGAENLADMVFRYILCELLNDNLVLSAFAQIELCLKGLFTLELLKSGLRLRVRLRGRPCRAGLTGVGLLVLDLGLMLLE